MILKRCRHENIFRLVKEIFLGHEFIVGIFLTNDDRYVDKGEAVCEVIKGHGIFMGKVHKNDDHLFMLGNTT